VFLSLKLIGGKRKRDVIRTFTFRQSREEKGVVWEGTRGGLGKKKDAAFSTMFAGKWAVPFFFLGLAGEEGTKWPRGIEKGKRKDTSSTDNSYGRMTENNSCPQRKKKKKEKGKTDQREKMKEKGR